MKEAEYEIITVLNGKNIHSKVRLDINNKIYEDCRFFRGKSFFLKIPKFLVVRRANYDATSDPDRPDSLSISNITLGKTESIGSDLLYTVETNRNLGTALRGLFKKSGLGFNLGGKKVIFIAIALAVAVVVVMVYTGYLKIPGLNS